MSLLRKFAASSRDYDRVGNEIPNVLKRDLRKESKAVKALEEDSVDSEVKKTLAKIASVVDMEMARRFKVHD